MTPSTKSGIPAIAQPSHEAAKVSKWARWRNDFDWSKFTNRLKNLLVDELIVTQLDFETDHDLGALHFAASIPGAF